MPGTESGRALDAPGLAAEVRAGRLAATDAVDGSLHRAHDQARWGAFWRLLEARARARAKRLDTSVTDGLPLAGVPVAVKDSFDISGVPTSGGLTGAHPAAASDAEAVRRLEAAGAVVIGKTAMDPLAWTTHGQAEGFPACLNPVEPTLSPGGSSSGSAVAVAAGIVPLALGSDTAGSIRIPAAYCGVVGLKAPFAAIPLQGCLPLSPSCDTGGVLADTVAGCAAGYDALAGTHRAALAARAVRLSGRIAVLQDLFDASEGEVSEPCLASLPRLEAAGAQLEFVEFGWWARGLGLLLAVEFAAAWGTRADADPSRFSPVMLAAIERARSLSPARYEQVQSELASARHRLSRRFGDYVAVVSPTVPVAVPRLEQEDVGVSTRFTRIFNALGWPALSLPCGQDRAGRPVGLHIASAESVTRVVRVAAALERSLPA